MKTAYSLIICAAGMLGLTGCQDKDYDIVAPILSPISAESITREFTGDTLGRDR